MIRAGARAPAPPPIASPKPRVTSTEDHVTRGRLARVRQSGGLRDRVVQLARRSQERKENRSPEWLGDPAPPQQDGGAENKKVTVVVYDLNNGNNYHPTSVTRVGTTRVVVRRGTITANLPTDHSQAGKWNRATLVEKNADVEQTQVPQSSPSLPKSAARRARQAGLPEVAVKPSPPASPRHADRPQTRPTTIRTLRMPSKIVINQEEENAEDHLNGKTSAGSPRNSSESSNSRHQKHGMGVRGHGQRGSTGQCSPQSGQDDQQKDDFRHQNMEHTEEASRDSPRQNSDGNPGQTSSSHQHSPHHPHPPPRAAGFNYQRAARVLSAAAAAHTPAHTVPSPPAQEPTKRARAALARDRRGPIRPKSVKLRAEECSSHYQSTGSSGESPTHTSRQHENEGPCEIVGSAVPTMPSHSPITSPRRHDNSRHANSFSASLEMFKRRLRLNQNRYVKDEPQVYEDEDYVIRLGDTKPSEPHYSTPLDLTDHHVPDALGSADEVESPGWGAEDEGNSDQKHMYRLSESTEDLPFMSLGKNARAPLPKVKTYVLEEDSKRLKGRDPDKPAALTQHNLSLHNSLLQRRAEREKMKLARAERELKRNEMLSGVVVEVGAGMGLSSDMDTRMKRWLLDTEHQRDLQPVVEDSFKIAVACP